MGHPGKRLPPVTFPVLSGIGLHLRVGTGGSPGTKDPTCLPTHYRTLQPDPSPTQIPLTQWANDGSFTHREDVLTTLLGPSYVPDDDGSTTVWPDSHYDRTVFRFRSPPLGSSWSRSTDGLEEPTRPPAKGYHPRPDPTREMGSVGG